MSILSWLFWPNLGTASYGNPTILALLFLSFALIVVAVVIRMWRAKQQAPVLRRLSKSWAGASVAFGLVALLLTLSRAEGVSYLSMRALWFVWAAMLVAYVVLQVRKWKARFYEVLPTQAVHDPRDKYLPRKKKR